MGFFDVLEDVIDPDFARDQRLRRDVNSALADEAQLAARLGQLEHTVAQQERQLGILRAVVQVLSSTLRDTGVVDSAVLDYRIEAALEEAQLAQQPVASAQDTIACGLCSRRVPRSSTTITADGVRCDQCAG